MSNRFLLPIALCIASVISCTDTKEQISIFSENFDGTVKTYTTGASYTTANCSNNILSATGLTCLGTFALTPISNDASGSGKFLFEGTLLGGSYQGLFYNITLTGQQWFSGYAFTISFKVALADTINSPSLQPLINEVAVGALTTPTAINSWQTLSFVYTPSSNLMSPVFSLYNTQSTSIGNDFGIDDINISVLTLDALPLSSFLTFSATPEKKGEFLKWSSPVSQDSYHFVAERSTDGILYDSIGTVSGLENEPSSQQYSFTDLQPLQGINFYRIRLNGPEGKYYYSTISKVNWEISSLGFNIFPMPAKKQFIILLQKPGNSFYSISLINASGKLCYYNNITLANNQLPVYLPNDVAPGLYFVKVTGSNESFFGKVVLQ